MGFAGSINSVRTEQEALRSFGAAGLSTDAPCVSDRQPGAARPAPCRHSLWPAM